jgi:hypothetical protein
LASKEHDRRSIIHISEALLHAIKAALFFCMTGAIIILIAIVLRDHFTLSPIDKTMVELLEKIGEACIVVGLVDVIIHLPDWNRYFLDNIRRSIMEDEYLDRLDDDALKALIGRALRIRLGNPAITLTTKGGFLDYLLSDIQQFIAEPYREGVVEEITCGRRDDDFFDIHDKISYTCRESAGKIQTHVKWQNDPDEIAEMTRITITIMPPAGKEIIIYDGDKDQVAADFPDNWVQRQLPDVHRQDGLGVIIESTYKVRQDIFQCWTMAHLTRNLKLVLKYPKGFTVQTSFLGIDKDLAVLTPPDKPGETSYEIVYWRWILPLSGIAWKFIPPPRG